MIMIIYKRNKMATYKLCQRITLPWPGKEQNENIKFRISIKLVINVCNLFNEIMSIS